jgi:hypothetical protein
MRTQPIDGDVRLDALGTTAKRLVTVGGEEGLFLIGPWDERTGFAAERFLLFLLLRLSSGTHVCYFDGATLSLWSFNALQNKFFATLT